MALKKAKLIEKLELTHDVFELKFECNDKFELIGGQFITIKISDGGGPCFRAYSVSSMPQESQFELCIKIVEGGRGTNWLNQLKINDEIEFLGPNGKFILKTPAQKKVLFIATGTGVAPFKAIVEEQLAANSAQNFHLIFGVRSEKDVFYEDWAINTAEKNKNFSYEITLSRPETENWHGKTGRVTEILKTSQLSPENTEVYICGLKHMIDDTTEILKEKGFAENTIHFEKYD